MKYFALLAAASFLLAAPGCGKDGTKTAEAKSVKVKVSGMT